MLKLFRHKRRKILGVDICPTCVKIIEITSSGDEYFVDGYGIATLPDNAMEGAVVKDINAVAYCIRTLLQTNHLNCKKAALAVPDSLAISRTIQVHEGMKDDEIEELVMMEADKYIPYPIDEINLDFKVLGTSSKNTAMQDVLIVASRSENVSNRIEVITRAGLDPVIVDVESFAVERSMRVIAPDLPSNGENKIIAIIDVGETNTDIFVLYNMEIIFTREEEFGGMQLIQSIMQAYDLSAEDATKAYYENTLPETFKSEILQPFIELLLIQVKRGLQVFFSSGNYTYVDHILLAGGITSRIPGIVERLHEHLNIPTAIANPVKYMTIADNIDKDAITKASPALLVACGLALRTSSEQ